MHDFPTFNIPDILALLVVAVGVCQGYRRRLSGELAHLISVAAALVFGIYLYQPIGAWMLGHSRLSGRAADAAAFVFTIVAAAIIMVIIRITLKKIMKIVIEEEVDKTCGCIAGFARSLVFVIIFFLMMNMIPHEYINRKFGEESVIGRQIIGIIPEIKEEAERVLDGQSGEKKARR